MKKNNKYCYGWNIYTNYGYGWEVESTYDKKETTYAQVKKDAQEYRIAGARVRISNTRWLKQLTEDKEGRCPSKASQNINNNKTYTL